MTSENESYPECNLGSVISPGEYWLVSKYKAHVNEVRDLEEELSDEINAARYEPPAESLKRDTCVAVGNLLGKHVWQRGRIVSSQQREVYNVFLIDYGYSVEVNKKNIFVITDPKFAQVEPLSFKFCLYGLVPMELQLGKGDSTAKYRKSNSWITEAKTYVDDLFSQKLKIAVKKIHMDGRTIHGDLYICNELNQMRTSLRELLCVNKFALFDKPYYNAKMMGHHSLRHLESEENQSIKVDQTPLTPEMKMERIRKWLQKNSSTYETSDPENKTAQLETFSDDPQVDDKKLDYSSKSLNTDTSKTSLQDVTSPECKSVRSGTHGTIESCDLSNSQSVDGSMVVEWDSEFLVFTSFKDSPIEPLDSFKDAGIFPDLLKWSNFKQATPIQRWGIPAILKGHNVVLIGYSGKTLTYVLPMFEVVRDSMRQSQPGNGPIAIVICSDLDSCKRSLQIMTNLQDNKIRILFSHSILHGSNLVQLTNGCEVLVTTPRYLLRFLESRTITNLDRLKFLVLDDIHIITQKPCFSEVRNILSEIHSLNECQIVVCGREWTKEVEFTCRSLMKSSAFIMQSLLEAALYNKLKPDVLFVDHSKKPQVLLDLIRDKVGTRKILIVCDDSSDVSAVSESLNNNGISQHAPVIAISDEGGQSKLLNGVSVENPILICTDRALVRSIRMYDVDFLIHYTLPVYKSDFDIRFATIMSNYKSRSLPNKKLKKHEPKSPEVVILIDDMNSIQLPSIVEIVKRSGRKVPDKVEDICCKILQTKEAGKMTRLCKNMMKFGECKKMKKCNDRHAFVNEANGRIANVPRLGFVKFRVLSTNDVTHVTGRLTAFSENGSVWIDIPDLTETIAEELETYGKCSELEPLARVKLCSLCVFQMDRSKLHRPRFFRGKVVEVRGMKCDVLAIDTGETFCLDVSDLYEVPDHLRDLHRFPPQSTEIYLCNLMPGDYGSSWPDEVVKDAKEFFESIGNEQFFIGKIVMSVDLSLHVDHVKLCHESEKLKAVVVDETFRNWVLRDGLTVDNPSHVAKLTSLREMEDTDTFRSEEGKNREPDWQVLDGRHIPVELGEIESASKLYLLMSENKEKLEVVENKCRLEGERAMANQGGDSFCTNQKIGLSVGMYCIALHDDVWKRSRLESIESGKCRLFSIDHGNHFETKNLTLITNSLLTELPAQAIECTLAGIGSNNTNFLQEIHKFSNSTMLHADAVERILDDKAAGGRKYKVNLYNSTGLSFSSHLVGPGRAEVDETTPGFGIDVTEPPVPMNVKVRDKEEQENMDGGSESERDDKYESEGEGDAEGDGGNDVRICGIREESANDASDPSYFVKMPDDVFDNENAVLMLEEFIGSVFPNALTRGLGQTESDGNESDRDDEAPTTDRRRSVGRSEDVTTNNSTRGIVRYTPTVLWSQTHSKITLKVDLSNVAEYRLDASHSYILFRCNLNDKLYVVSLKLFGAVSPTLTQVDVKTFHVLIVLMKLCPLEWPRLHRDEAKYRWIKYDADHVEEDVVDRILKNNCQGGDSEMDGSDPRKALEELTPLDVSYVPLTDDSEEVTDNETDEYSDEYFT